MGIEFPDISPIIFSIGPVAIRWYSMAYLVGIVSAWVLVNRDIERYGLRFQKKDIEDLAFYGTLGVILGGRIGYVLFYGQEEFFDNPLQIFAIWNGGMSFHGGILGVLLAIYLFSRKVKRGFFEVSDMMVPYVPIGIFLGRLANFVNDELWGRVTTVSWAVRFPSGGYLPRHPSQLYEALLEGLLMFVILNILWRNKAIRNKMGTLSGAFAVLYGVFRMSMEQFREPDAHMGFYFGSITMGQMLSLPLIFVGLYVMIRPWWSRSA